VISPLADGVGMQGYGLHILFRAYRTIKMQCRTQPHQSALRSEILRHQNLIIVATVLLETILLYAVLQKAHTRI
jgi:hypothetical protein